jgi:hypothetical protein
VTGGKREGLGDSTGLTGELGEGEMTMGVDHGRA